MFKKKKYETDEEIKERLLKLCKEDSIIKDKDIWCPPYMDAQVALDEICRYLLGDDWYITDPINNEQGNTIIVYEIERKYRRKR